ncbi:MAG TPA: cation:proton antiporter [Thermoleophilaceae bacterium]|nr:cation:proton antiporter [Thermoleophilaceae bacterium]
MDNELAVLGAALLLAGLFARFGRRLGLPTIPFFIVAGIVFGPNTPGLVVLDDPEGIHLLATLGLVLLLFHLGIEFSIDDLMSGGRRLLWAGGSYIVLNFGAGLVLGWALGWGTREIFVIAGMIGTSSTAIVTKLLLDLRRVSNPETGMILGIIVVEDVFIAFYLALLQPILGDQQGAYEILESIAIAFAFLTGLFALARWGARLVRPLISADDAELTIILSVGFGVFVAGFAHIAGASDAVGALLAGMVVAGTGIGPRVERLLVPLRDTFAAIFFFWFGLTIAPSDMGAVASAVAVAVAVTLLFNVVAGVVAARVYGYGRLAASNTALMLVSRGEFELILASLAVAAGLDSRVAPFAALYVLVLSILSPLLSARSHVLARWLPRRLFGPDSDRDAAEAPPPSEPIIEVGALRRLGAETVAHLVRPNHAIVDMYVRDLGLPRDALVSVIVRSGEAIAPRGSTRIRAGNRLHVLVRREAARELDGLQERWRDGPIGAPPRPRRQTRGSSPVWRTCGGESPAWTRTSAPGCSRSSERSRSTCSKGRLARRWPRDPARAPAGQRPRAAGELDDVVRALYPAALIQTSAVGVACGERREGAGDGPEGLDDPGRIVGCRS